MNTNKRKKYDKFVVVCIAGQSNAVGFDESPVNKKIAYKNLDNSRIKQLGFYLYSSIYHLFCLLFSLI